MTSADPTPAVPQLATDIRPLLIGAEVPDVALQAPDGRLTRLRDTVTGHPAVLIFYRGGWCPYCSIQLSQLAQVEEQLLDQGNQVSV